MNKNKKEKRDNTHNYIPDFAKKPSIDTDPLGSWTGTPDDPDDTPVQDADDL